MNTAHKCCNSMDQMGLSIDPFIEKINNLNTDFINSNYSSPLKKDSKFKKSEILTNITNDLIKNNGNTILIPKENWDCVTNIESDQTKIFNTICQKASSYYHVKLDFKKFKLTNHILSYSLEYIGKISFENEQTNPNSHDTYTEIEKLKLENEKLKLLIEIKNDIDEIKPIMSLLKDVKKIDIDNIINFINCLKKTFTKSKN